MMLCRTTAVFSWQVCKWEPQQTATGSGSESCQKQDGRRGDGAHSETQEPISTTGTASRSSHSPKSWTQHSIESLSPTALTQASTPGHGHMEDMDVGPGPETLLHVSFRILWRFHAVFSRDAWTRTRLDSFPAMGEMGKGARMPLKVCWLEGVSTRFRPKIISCLEAQSKWSSGGGEICTENWPWGNEKITVEIQDKASTWPYKLFYFYLVFRATRKTIR